MVGWHHWLNGREFEQTPGDGEGQGSLASCSSWGHKESDMTEWLNDKIDSSAVVTKLVRHQNHPEGLLKPSLLGPTLSVWSVGWGLVPRICISNKFQGMLMLPVQEPHHQNPWLEPWGRNQDRLPFRDGLTEVSDPNTPVPSHHV